MNNDAKNGTLQHEADIIAGILDAKERYQKIVRAAIGQWVKDLQGGHIKMNSVDDLKKLIELDIELHSHA